MEHRVTSVLGDKVWSLEHQQHIEAINNFDIILFFFLLAGPMQFTLRELSV